MILDPDGRVSVAGHARRNVWRMESLDPKAQITILADSYQGKKLNSPMIWCTNLMARCTSLILLTVCPPKRTTIRKGVAGQWCLSHSWSTTPEAWDRTGTDQLQLVIKDLPRPNGICFSPDEKYLYIADSGKKIWMRYRMQPDGSVTDGALFLDASHESAPGVPDGIRVDKEETSTAPAPAACGLFLRRETPRHNQSS